MHVPHPRGQCPGFSWSQITLNYERWSCTSLLSSPNLFPTTNFQRHNIGGLKSAMTGVFIPWKLANVQIKTYLFIYSFITLFMYSFIHWKASCETFTSTPLVPLQWPGGCTRAGNFSDLYFIILLYFQLLDNMVYNRNSGSNGKVHFSMSLLL